MIKSLGLFISTVVAGLSISAFAQSQGNDPMPQMIVRLARDGSQVYHVVPTGVKLTPEYVSGLKDTDFKTMDMLSEQQLAQTSADPYDQFEATGTFHRHYFPRWGRPHHGYGWGWPVYAPYYGYGAYYGIPQFYSRPVQCGFYGGFSFWGFGFGAGCY